MFYTTLQMSGECCVSLKHVAAAISLVPGTYLVEQCMVSTLNVSTFYVFLP